MVSCIVQVSNPKTFPQNVTLDTKSSIIACYEDMNQMINETLMTSTGQLPTSAIWWGEDRWVANPRRLLIPELLHPYVTIEWDRLMRSKLLFNHRHRPAVTKTLAPRATLVSNWIDIEDDILKCFCVESNTIFNSAKFTNLLHKNLTLPLKINWVVKITRLTNCSRIESHVDNSTPTINPL